MCTIPLLRRICRESYTEPEALYETMKARGMDLVTVTDHDSIGAAEVLRKHPDFFISVEVTCTMPSGTELHVAAYDVTERQHLEAQRRRDDLESLVAFLREQGLMYSVNHVFSALTGKRAPEDWRTFEFLFQMAEIRNGAMPSASNRHAKAWARQTGMIGLGGSDAHSLNNAGRTYTEVRYARTKEEFLAALRAGAGRVHGEYGSWRKLTHEVMAIGSSMLKENWRTLPLAPLAALIPLITAIAYTREILFAESWAVKVLSRGAGDRLLSPASAD